MIDLTGTEVNEGIDQDILAAFERGTQKHVEKAFERLTQDMEEASAAALGQSLGINGDSLVDKGIVESVATVAKASRDLFVCAANLQVCSRVCVCYDYCAKCVCVADPNRGLAHERIFHVALILFLHGSIPCTHRLR